MNFGVASSKLISKSAELGDAGGIYRVFHVEQISGAGGAGVVTLKSGGSSGTSWVQLEGTQSKGTSHDFGFEGILFTNGCYVTLGANSASALVTYRKEL